MKRPGKMLGLLMSSAMKKPVTTTYPAVKAELPENYRGKIKFFPDRCIGCRLCMRDCPSEAIEIVKVGEKKFEAHFNLGRCIYCAQCVDSCNKDALAITGEFELAQFSRDALKITYHHADAPVEKAPEEP